MWAQNDKKMNAKNVFKSKMIPKFKSKHEVSD